LFADLFQDSDKNELKELTKNSSDHFKTDVLNAFVANRAKIKVERAFKG
jgi:hypothetical protein